MSVEGLWQGLKVFESAGIDYSKLIRTSMSGLKRTAAKFGTCRGHQLGLESEESTLLGYLDARRRIYLPAYLWVLKNKLQAELKELRGIANKRDIVFLDYETNEDIENLKTPLSHAGLIKRFLLNRADDEFLATDLG